MSRLFRLVCACGATARAEVSDNAPANIAPLALALRAAAKKGWIYRGGRIGKSVVDIVCPACRDPLYLEGDVAPADAEPGTYELDLTAEPAEPTLKP